jgi:hypothetical protein
VLAWVRKTGNSGRNFLVIDQIADELHGLRNEDDESEDSDLSIEIATESEAFGRATRGNSESSAQTIRTVSGSEEHTRRNTLEGSSKLMDQLIVSLSQLETVHSNASMEFSEDIQNSPTESGVEGKFAI